jgi:hypothetical protein
MLRGLLDFARTGKLGAGTLTGGDFESPFEEAVARTIREAGFQVHPQVGVKGFRLTSESSTLLGPASSFLVLNATAPPTIAHVLRVTVTGCGSRSWKDLVGVYTASGARIGSAIQCASRTSF